MPPIRTEKTAGHRHGRKEYDRPTPTYLGDTSQLFPYLKASEASAVNTRSSNLAVFVAREGDNGWSEVAWLLERALFERGIEVHYQLRTKTASNSKKTFLIAVRNIGNKRYAHPDYNTITWIGLLDMVREGEIQGCSYRHARVAPPPCGFPLPTETLIATLTSNPHLAKAHKTFSGQWHKSKHHAFLANPHSWPPPQRARSLTPPAAAGEVRSVFSRVRRPGEYWIARDVPMPGPEDNEEAPGEANPVAEAANVAEGEAQRAMQHSAARAAGTEDEEQGAPDEVNPAAEVADVPDEEAQRDVQQVAVRAAMREEYEEELVPYEDPDEVTVVRRPQMAEPELEEVEEEEGDDHDSGGSDADDEGSSDSDSDSDADRDSDGEADEEAAMIKGGQAVISAGLKLVAEKVQQGRGEVVFKPGPTRLVDYPDSD